MKAIVGASVIGGVLCLLAVTGAIYSDFRGDLPSSCFFDDAYVGVVIWFGILGLLCAVVGFYFLGLIIVGGRF